MTTKQDFFTNPDTQSAIFRAISKIEQENPRNDFLKLLAGHVVDFLKILTGKENAISFDNSCQYSIQTGGASLLKSLNLNVGGDGFVDWLQRIALSLYRLSLEFDLAYSPLEESLREIADFNSFVKSTEAEFPPLYAGAIKSLEERTGFLVAKFILNDPDLKNFREVKKYSNEIEGKISDWKTELSDNIQKVTNLKDALARYEQEFNFVGLAKGFSDLVKKKRRQLNVLRVLTFVFGSLILAPICLELSYAYSKKINLLTDWPILAASAIPAISLVLIFLYFFKIVVRNSDSVRSQILQLELRLTLCQFVESYTKFAIDARKNNNELLNKFDAIIFSSIVGSDEKIPSTFEGAEQLMNLVKNLAPGK